MSQSVNPFDFNPFFSGMDFFTGKTANAWPLPSVNPQELDKRISELKTVLFWLEQNTAAVRAGIQALQVQKMTLTALQSMNLSAAEMMRAFTMPAAAASAPATGGGAAPNAFNTAPNTASQTAPKTAPDTAPEAAPDKAASAAPDPLQCAHAAIPKHCGCHGSQRHAGSRWLGQSCASWRRARFPRLPKRRA